MAERVVVGLSGGVDSSVAAYLLKKQGYDVVGMFMKNWHDTSVTISDECPWIDDSHDAMLVAEKLDIPFQTIDLSEEYRKRIVDYMFAEYSSGRTPNPDVLCNREIKFDVFLNAAKKLGADYVATGHYCRKEITDNGKIYRLLSGADSNKDQSYFLCQVSQEQLSKSLFPIGHLQKAEVREIAREQNLVTAEKKDSQGLCFIGKVRLPDFLQQQLKPKEGDVIEIPTNAKLDIAKMAVGESESEWLKRVTTRPNLSPDMGVVIGKHNGAHFYTIGQRKGLQIGGKESPLFVLAIDTVDNVVYVGQGESHPLLYGNGLFIPSKDVHWVRPDLQLAVGDSASYGVRIRYRQTIEIARLYSREEGLYIVFESPKKAVAPGQFAAWYIGDELIGSGVISK